MTQQYSKKVLEHFFHPKYVGEMKNPDGIGEAGNPICGDILKIYITIGERKKKEKYIKEISFQTLGCCAAIAVSDVVCGLVKGKTLEKALKIKGDEVVKLLGGLPTFKYHCSLLAVDALVEAIYDYLSRNKKPVPKEIQKRHQRIAKERKIIEEKHKDWKT